jgi:uncharacterized protein YjbJ (UPF0337 family)
VDDPGFEAAVKGIAQGIAGKFKEMAGELIEDEDLEHEGIVQQLQGKIRRATNGVDQKSAWTRAASGTDPTMTWGQVDLDTLQPELRSRAASSTPSSEVDPPTRPTPGR